MQPSIALRAGAALLALAAATAATAQTAAPANDAAVRWPRVPSPIAPQPALEKRIDALIAGMSDEDKVAQIIQPDIGAITLAELGQHRFGSILAGGNSAPGGNEKAPASAWLAYADKAYDAIMAAPGKGPAIPPVWGIDAVHGHANIIGATIFPQNIGLGAMRDPDLIRRIGAVTAKEMAVTGIEWDFSPTLAVVRDDRWGRSYEGFSEDPSVVSSYAGAMVEGLQGKPGTKEFRQGLHDAIENMGRTIFSHGVMNWTKDDHWGYTNETGVMLKVVDGKFKVE